MSGPRFDFGDASHLTPPSADLQAAHFLSIFMHMNGNACVQQ
jgi:hypothetical protein